MKKTVSIGVLILTGLSYFSASAQGPASPARTASAEKPSINKESPTSQTTAPAQITNDSDAGGEAARKPPSKSISSHVTSVLAQDSKGRNQSSEGSRTGSSSPPSAAGPAASDDALATIYRVGIGDILNIRLFNLTTSGSTLFTVLEGGFIEFPLTGGTVAVAGLTTDEIQTRLAGELKRRALQDDAQVSVSVRQYASHAVIVTGLVASPGMKILRREAVPLYVILAEAQPRLDAAQATIMRPNAPALSVDLSKPDSMSVLVRSGDLVAVSARPQQFYYIAGRVNYPGQKNFQPGITLLQSILAAGGLSRPDVAVEISREGFGGNLITSKYNLKEIKLGKMPDPRLEPGDRIQVLH
jgi:protein involved in polysaccharide export with SLBB domain